MQPKLQLDAESRESLFFEVGLFKGDAYPNNSGRGAVHRSPRTDEAGAWRVMATLDEIN